DLTREDSFGHHFDAGGLRNLGAEADAVADGFANFLAKGMRHPLGAGARGYPTRLQHDDLLGLGPRLIKQCERHARGLAGARRRNSTAALWPASVRGRSSRTTS